MTRRFAKQKWLGLALVLILAIIAAAVYFLSLRDSPSPVDSISPTEMKVENDYRPKARSAFAQLSNEPDRQAAKVKDELLKLRVSENDKALHLKLVMASAAFAEYEAFKDPNVLKEAQDLLSEIAASYPWILSFDQ